MSEPTDENRQTQALEQTARNTDLLLLIAQLWTFAAVIGVVVWLIWMVKG